MLNTNNKSFIPSAIKKIAISIITLAFFTINTKAGNAQPIENFSGYRQWFKIYPGAYNDTGVTFNTLFLDAGGSLSIRCGNQIHNTRRLYRPNFVLEVTRTTEVDLGAFGLPGSEVELSVFIFKQASNQKGICATGIGGTEIGFPFLDDLRLTPGIYGVYVGVRDDSYIQNPGFIMHMDVEPFNQ